MKRRENNEKGSISRRESTSMPRMLKLRKKPSFRYREYPIPRNFLFYFINVGNFSNRSSFIVLFYFFISWFRFFPAMFEFPREERIQIFAKLEIELEKSIKARKFPPPQEIVDNRQQSRPKTDLFFFFSFSDSCFPCLVTRVAALWGWHLTTRRFLFGPQFYSRHVTHDPQGRIPTKGGKGRSEPRKWRTCTMLKRMYRAFILGTRLIRPS